MIIINFNQQFLLLKILPEAAVDIVAGAIDSSTAISASGALPKASIGAMQ